MALPKRKCTLVFDSVADAARALGKTRAAIHNAEKQGYRVGGAQVRLAKKAVKS